MSLEEWNGQRELLRRMERFRTSARFEMGTSASGNWGHAGRPGQMGGSSQGRGLSRSDKFALNKQIMDKPLSKRLGFAPGKSKTMKNEPGIRGKLTPKAYSSYRKTAKGKGVKPLSFKAWGKLIGR